MDKRSREELLADAAKSRNEAQRFRRTAVLMNDPIIEATLIARAI
jgi:hypothetical protein